MTGTLPPLRLLTAFAAIARSGSVQAAAAELNVTQPAISQAVKQLEAHVGVELLDRGCRPARPTEAGQLLAAAVADGLGRISDTLEMLQIAGAQRATTVTVACSVGVATYWLMPRLKGLYRTRPELLVNVMTAQSGVPALADGVDVAIRFGHGRWSDGTVHHLFDESVEPVAAPEIGAQVSAAGTAGTVPLLHVKSSETSWVTWAGYLRATGQPDGPRGGQTFTNYVQTTQAALEGRGMMLGWRSITGALVASGELVTLGLPSLAPPDAFYLVAHRKRRGPAIETFAAWLLSQGGAQASADDSQESQ